MKLGQVSLDAEALYLSLLKGVDGLMAENTRLVGITSGGAWLAKRLAQDLPQKPMVGVISSAMHRDDFDKRGLSDGGQTVLPFEIEGADIVLIDDVLFTGRTIRAVINELFDYGRPGRVRLAVLVDRGERELPIQANFSAASFTLGKEQSLALALNEKGNFHFSLEN
jgi:pyrimidine operon attenuation protein / uracil phosphoribosyltransferase